MTTDQATAPPAWAKGYGLEQLREIAELYREQEAMHVHGLFGRTKEREVAEWLAAGRLRHGPGFAYVAQRVARPQAVKDFTGQPRFTMPAGALHVHHVAGDYSLADADLRSHLEECAAGTLTGTEEPVYLTGFTEDEQVRLLADAHGLLPLGTKISAASDMRTTHGPGGLPYDRTTAATLVPLRLPGLAGPVAALAEALTREHLPWADHYASYNVGHTWSALALRGFSEDANDIVKPAEMSRAWKQANAERLSSALTDTWLRPLLPEAEPLLAMLPGEFERVRLMRLDPGGGELTRHADITDPDVGTGSGQTLRIHLPLVTNEQVAFTAWLLDGQQRCVHMPVGTAWYLDTRKPHTAINGGTTERVHLVVDVFSTPALLNLLATG